MLLGVLFLITFVFGDASVDSRYECGAHGRFEYCIDGFPGCVVGCHCYPGYYFDTDSKICEPNFKLIEHHRRFNAPELTSSPLPNKLISTTMKNSMEVKIDPKNNDDLGDWLYNQFFKTIENQVINNTDSAQLTRRSGSNQPSLKRKKHKKSKKKPKNAKQRSKKAKTLRRKLLRITEDDSIFHSSSEDFEEDESSDRSSDEVSESTSSETEYDRGSDEDPHRPKDDRDHNHKKIVIVNKKPRPPLPSFIFLPNMDTPFYPPLALPAPPAVPMYPLVPVPPMVPMYPNYPGPPFCTETSDNCTTSTSAVATTILTPTLTTIASVSSDTTTIESTIVTMSTEIEKPTSPESGVTEQSSDMTSVPAVDTATEVNPALRNSHLRKQGPREKFMKLMKEKRKKMRKQLGHNFGPRNIEAPLAPKLDLKFDMIPKPNNFYDEFSPTHQELTNNNHIEKLTAEKKPETVDFKYLTELIHKFSPNLSKKSPLQAPQQIVRKQPITALPPRNLDTYPVNRRILHDTTSQNEKYYSELGKQIASLIRKIDTKGEREVNIEIDEIKNESPYAQPYFNDNNYGSRSYWERSIRSLLDSRIPQLRLLSKNHNSKEILYDLENKVNIAATTVRSIGLMELEDIVNFVETAKRIESQTSQVPKLKQIMQSNKNLNINLLPKANYHTWSDNKSVQLPKTSKEKTKDSQKSKHQKPQFLKLQNLPDIRERTKKNINFKTGLRNSKGLFIPSTYNDNSGLSKNNYTTKGLHFQTLPYDVSQLNINYKAHQRYLAQELHNVLAPTIARFKPLKYGKNKVYQQMSFPFSFKKAKGRLRMVSPTSYYFHPELPTFDNLR